MITPQIRLEDCGAHGPNRRVIVVRITAEGQEGEINKTEVVDVYSASGREEFAKTICTRYPRYEIEDMVAKLETIAAKVALERGDRKRGGKKKCEERSLQGCPMMFEGVEPWHEPVAVASLLEEITSTIERFMVMPKQSVTAVALWIAFSWVIDSFAIAAILILKSPVMRCGKTRLLAVIRCLVPRPLLTGNISEAAIFRSIERYQPTLLIDEADLKLDDNDGIRAVLNAGHTKSTSFVHRCEGDGHEPKQFSVWCPKVVAGIGKRRATMEDRAIITELQRENQARERTERLSPERLVEELLPLRRQLARFADDNAETLRQSRPEVPSSLNDRAADNWEPLLAIADLGSEKWKREARISAEKLACKESDPEDGGSLLLAELEHLLHEGNLRPTPDSEGREILPSREIVDALLEDKASRWQEWGRKRVPITQAGVSRLLRKFGLRSERPRVPSRGSKKVSGYAAQPLREAIKRYVRVKNVDSTHPALPVCPESSCTSTYDESDPDQEPARCAIPAHGKCGNEKGLDVLGRVGRVDHAEKDANTGGEVPEPPKLSHALTLAEDAIENTDKDPGGVKVEESPWRRRILEIASEDGTWANPGALARREEAYSGEMLPGLWCPEEDAIDDDRRGGGS